MSYRDSRSKGVSKPKTKVNNSRSSDRRLAAGRAPASYLHTAMASSAPIQINPNNNISLSLASNINNNSNRNSALPSPTVSGIAAPAFQYVHPSTSNINSTVTAATFTTTNNTQSANQKTVQRQVGNLKWQDPTLLEWDPNHFRLFVGNLGTDANDELLYRAFMNYPSLTKVRVPIDNKSKANKGYGFVAFSDPDDYFKAFKEMNGKYIGQHPVQLKRAQTEIKPVAKKTYGNKKNRNKNKRY